MLLGIQFALVVAMLGKSWASFQVVNLGQPSSTLNCMHTNTCCLLSVLSMHVCNSPIKYMEFNFKPIFLEKICTLR